MLVEAPTLAELLGATIIVFGLGLSLWALIDDVWDLYNVKRYGEIGGPRWISAEEHLWHDLSFLIAWCCWTVVIAIAIYLPTRTDQPSDILSTVAGWARFGATVMFLAAQVNRRIGRTKLRKLPLEAWERMLTSMMSGMSPEQRTSLTVRLLLVRDAGREMGHAVNNLAQAPIAVLDLIAEDPDVSPERRAEAQNAVEQLERLLTHTRALHAAIREQGGLNAEGPS